MEQSLEDMYRRAETRKQFGMKIRDFELIQEKMVAAAAHAFAAAAMTAATASLLEEDRRGPYAVESSHVKLYGTTRAWDTLYEALQTAGGSGYLATNPYEKRMRDFRVTTVFEGTSEIHSIYPALYLVRKIGKILEGRGRVFQALHLLRHAYSSPGIDLDYSEPVMKRAAGVSSDLSRAARRLVHMGLLKYGRHIVARQFLLRRITNLSMAGFGLLAAMAKTASDQMEGKDIKYELDLIDYLTQEACEILASSGRTGDSGLETAHRKVFARMISSEERDETAETGGREDE
jgi:acyl-CoA dehydrogenase family protein 9